jgi:hypothetical protein
MEGVKTEEVAKCAVSGCNGDALTKLEAEGADGANNSEGRLAPGITESETGALE